MTEGKTPPSSLLKVGPWAASTTAAADLDAVEKSYVEWLNYRVVGRGTVADDLALSWGAPKVGGSRYTTLEPESGKEVLLRIVENQGVNDFKPLTTYGWAASELVVEDADQLEAHFEKSPFHIIGPPADLEMVPEIRAMQVIGLAGEVFYLTMFKEDIPAYDLPTAHSAIDRMFIAVLATDGPRKVQLWYEQHFGIEVGNIADIKLKLLDDAFGVPVRSGDYQLTVVTMRGRSLIEVDGYPEAAKPRPIVDGYLPPGNAMMTVLVDTLDDLGFETISSPVMRPEAPYHGRRSATTRGAMGELIEFIEREAS